MNLPSRRLALGRTLATLFLAAASASAATSAKIEASFELPQVVGNPFDFTANDVRVALVAPDGKTITLPAFFDGGTTWRVRHAPTAVGKWTVRSVTLNGKDAAPKTIAPREFDVGAALSPGYVRIDPKDKKRFAFDDGTPYYPIGFDLAWHHGGEPKMGPLVDSIAKMKPAGVNWTRIWMNVWDGKNLDWLDPTDRSPKLGTLDLGVAKHWDDIVDAADRADVHFQMTLQHHGQYSTTTDSNWSINPWSTKFPGGFLADPAKFFTDEQARKLTRAKYRYIVARWGYSPAIMAWELFNEVESVDAMKSNVDDVAAWHKEMAGFIRAQDPYHHLVTTSSNTRETKLWPAMDYYQAHAYSPDLVTTVQALETRHFDKPYFYGEIGSNAFGTQADPSGAIHSSLWASLISNSAAGAMYWYWYDVEPRDLYYHYQSAKGFLDASGLAARRSTLKPIDVVAETGAQGPLKFGPGSGWGKSDGTRFLVKRNGTIENVGGISAYLQGTGSDQNRALFPFAEFEVDFAKDGTFAVRFDEMTPAGARVVASLDGKPVGTLILNAPPTPARPDASAAPRERQNARIDAALEVPVPAGKHVVKLDNQAADWVKLREFTVTPYASTLAVLAKGTNDYAVLWARKRDATADPSATADVPINGTLAVPGLDAGSYRVVWWDTTKGVVISEKTVAAKSGGPLTIDSGPVKDDVAIFVTRAPRS